MPIKFLVDPNQVAPEEILSNIRNWKIQETSELLRYIIRVWYLAGWNEEHTIQENWKDLEFTFHTWGMRYNESLIEAMKDNNIFWLTMWESSMRGGHHHFKPII